MPYAIYLRKSRIDAEAEARGEGETLERHRRVLYELAARMEIDIATEYREVVSGETIRDRPEMRRLLSDVSSGMYDGIFVMEIERLARGDTVDQGLVAQTFKYSNTRIITPFKTYDPSNEADDLFLAVGLLISRAEYNTIKRRLQAGRVASVQEGCYLGTRAPFGYQRVKLKGRKGWTLEIIQEEAEIVRMVYDLYANQGFKAYSIASKLERMGIPTYTGAGWSESRIRSLIRNPVYIGKVQWFQHETKRKIVDGVPTPKREKTEKHMVVDGLHPSIVSDELWDAANTIFARGGKTPIPDTGNLSNPLAGILKCGICGRTMVLRGRGPKTLKRYECPRIGCETTGVYARIVIDAVLDILTMWTVEYAPDKPTKNRDSDMKQKVILAKSKLTANIQQLNTQKARLHDLVEQGAYTIEEYTQRATELKRRILATKEELHALDIVPPDPVDTIRRAVPHIFTVLDAYDPNGSAEHNRVLFASILKRIDYNKTMRCLRGDEPSKHLKLIIHPLFFDD